MEMGGGYSVGIEAIPDLCMHPKMDLTIINFGLVGHLVAWSFAR
jgi:hypothetical protein